MDLKEWTIQYVKYKDMLKKDLKGYEEKEGFVEFRFKDKTQDYFFSEELKLEAAKDSDADQITLVCSCTEGNLKSLVSDWKKFSKQENLTIIFVNLEENNKWIIRPNVHARIADPDNLEEGLRSMYEQVASE